MSQEQAAMDSPFSIWIPQVTILRCHCLDDAREIDVLAGAVDALDGQVERIDTTTFLFTPAGVSITHT